MAVALKVYVNMLPMYHTSFYQRRVVAGHVNMLLGLGLTTEATPGTILSVWGVYTFGEVMGVRHPIKDMLCPAASVAGGAAHLFRES